MNYDFETVYTRNPANSVKHKTHPRYPENHDMIPMWIADMDFQTAPEIIDSLKAVSEQGLFGYTELDREYYDLLIAWNKKRFCFVPDRAWIVPCEGVMFGIAASIRALSEVNDSVLILQPVYYPFANVIKDNRRRLVVSELVNEAGRYQIDFEDLERSIIENRVKLLLFCSPHNPVGRVWSKEELERVASICLKNHVIMISDEIHSDLVYQRHYPLASLSREIAHNTVLISSVTKSFNLAGIKSAHLIISNADLRDRIKKEIRSIYPGRLGIMSVAATKAAYRYGEPWLEELLVFLKSNVDDVIRSFEDSKIRVIAPESTYLLWLDCRKLNFDEETLDAFFLRDCGVWLNSGYTFGKGGSGFMRMNIACPKQTLKEAICRIQDKLRG